MKPKWPCFWWRTVQFKVARGYVMFNTHKEWVNNTERGTVFVFNIFRDCRPQKGLPHKATWKEPRLSNSFVAQFAVKPRSSIKEWYHGPFSGLEQGLYLRTTTASIHLLLPTVWTSNPNQTVYFFPNSTTLRSSDFSHQNCYLHTCEELTNGKRNSRMNRNEWQAYIHIFIYIQIQNHVDIHSWCTILFCQRIKGMYANICVHLGLFGEDRKSVV